VIVGAAEHHAEVELLETRLDVRHQLLEIVLDVLQPELVAELAMDLELLELFLGRANRIDDAARVFLLGDQPLALLGVLPEARAQLRLFDLRKAL